MQQAYTVPHTKRPVHAVPHDKRGMWAQQTQRPGRLARFCFSALRFHLVEILRKTIGVQQLPGALIGLLDGQALTAWSSGNTNPGTFSVNQRD